MMFAMNGSVLLVSQGRLYAADMAHMAIPGARQDFPRVEVESCTPSESKLGAQSLPIPHSQYAVRHPVCL
jgi:hypothetical protein